MVNFIDKKDCCILAYNNTYDNTSSFDMITKKQIKLMSNSG